MSDAAKTDTLKNIFGPWVRGDDFFDREHEQAQLARRLLDGQHVSLIAQRRTGKTSLLRQVAENLDGQLTCLYVDLQDAKDAADAVVAITLATRHHQGLWTRARGAFANVLDGGVELGLDQVSIKLREGVLGDWSAKGDRVMADLAAAEPPIVLMLDELPVLLVRMLEGGRAPADAFLSWLRRVCLQHGPALRVVVTGSIGLGPVANRAGLSGTLNHYTPMFLEAWSPGVAMDCLAALARNYDVTLSSEAAEEVVQELGSCIPYHVQLFFSLLEEDARKRRAKSIDKLDVQRVYKQRMLSSYGHAELAHMEERLRLMVRPEHHTLTLELLTEAAVVGVLAPSAALLLAEDASLAEASRRTALREILGVLEHDGYLRPDDDGHRFKSKLLRDWWTARHKAFFIPAKDRTV